MSFQPGTRSALLVESTDKDGNKQLLVYHMGAPLMISVEQDFSTNFNMFDGFSSARPMPARITIEAYLMDVGPQPWNGDMPNPDQQEIEPVQLAITSDEELEEIVIEEDDFEDHWRED